MIIYNYMYTVQYEQEEKVIPTYIYMYCTMYIESYINIIP